MAALRLADEQDHRRRILLRRVDADRCVRCAGAARDEADAGLAGELAAGLGHVGRTALVPADDHPEAVLPIVERIEHGEIALTGHAEGEIGALGQERVEQKRAAGPRLGAVVRRIRTHRLNLFLFRHLEGARAVGEVRDRDAGADVGMAPGLGGVDIAGPVEHGRCQVDRHEADPVSSATTMSPGTTWTPAIATVWLIATVWIRDRR